jgi:cytochrome c biogenesis protein CcmG, thiol:disulfide interchange protein DsbE
MAGALAILGFGGVARSGADVGEKAPALIVPELSGQIFDLGALRGRVLVVNFWATWCPPCRKEMPTLNAFYERYHRQGLEMIGLSVDRSRDESDVRKVMQSFSYPAAMLDDAENNGFGSPTELPVTYVVDAEGVVRAKLTPDSNPITEKSLDDAVLPLLPRKPATTPSPGEGRRKLQ